MKKCPFCAEEIQDAAIKCKHCGSMLDVIRLRTRPYDYLSKPQYKGKGEYDRGVLATTLSEWSDFYREVREFRVHTDYVWRGQEQHGEGWELRSTFDRLNKDGDRDKCLEQHREAFEKAIMGRRGPNPPKLDENDLWALGQHQGLATPLLDWTESPFVAAYFALWHEKEDASERIVYGLNRDIERWWAGDPKNRLIEFPPITAHENARFLAQGGVFTKALWGGDVKPFVQECYNKDRHADRIILVEILIPDSCTGEGLKDLNWMNINHATLFPDLYGAAIFCNWKLEIG